MARQWQNRSGTFVLEDDDNQFQLRDGTYFLNDQGVSGNTITANQTEAGDATVANLEVLVQIAANQTEAGDSQTALIQVPANISANQTEAGDTQVVSLEVLLQIAANQTEAGDTQVADLSVLLKIVANPLEAGDTTAAALQALVQISANQTEAGDTQAAAITGVLTASITANQTEAGDTQAANLAVLLQIVANQLEAGDTQVASIVHQTFANITANQTEAGDIQIAFIQAEEGIPGALITILIDKLDNFEIVRDKIAAILTVEIANQQILATAAGKNPTDWKLRIFTERSNPWEYLLNANSDTPPEDTSPTVNVWFDNSNFNPHASDTIERQKSETVYNIDCYAYGKSKDDPLGGHIPGDKEAALEVHRTLRLVRNILMSGVYTYLGCRGLVWGRWPQSITSFQPDITGRQMQHVVGARLALKVEFNEFSPQVVAETLEFVSANVKRTEDGQIVINADYDYT